ncbi:MAG: hypothetical protein ABI556_07785 [Gemmatimonadales bacterium]
MRARIFGVIVAVALGTALPAGAQSNPPQAEPQQADTSYLTYADGPISLPLGIGLRIPSYNRVDGLVLPWGPKIRLAKERIQIDPTVTYRSHIGEFDPRVQAKLRLTQFDEIAIDGGRGTFTNDGWIRSDLINSLAAVGVGSDARNYFRADRVTAEFTHSIVNRSITLKPKIGVLHENAWSTGIPTQHNTAPWSALGRKDSLKMRRPNPAILEGHTTSATGGVGLVYEEADTKVSASADLEHAFDSPPVSSAEDGHFTQATLHSKAKFLTFGTQHFEFRGHGVFGFGDHAPPQRYAYLGGAGTLATVDLMALGGDKLLFVEGEYSIPLRKPILPYVGTPVVSLRYAAGAAGVGDLPDLIQNLGVGLGVKLVKIEYHIDPNYKKTSYTDKSAFSIGFSLSL